MPDPAVSDRIDQRLGELYERQLALPQKTVDRYYEPGRGYYGLESAGPERDTFGVALCDLDGELHRVGDHDEPFALQSLTKVLVYALALEDHGREHVLRHVGVEPTGEAFSSIVFDERENRPYNPMVNAGALATTDLVRGTDPGDKLDRILDVVRRSAGNERLQVDPATLERELRTADKNRATAYLMRSQGMLAGDVEATLSLYLQQCSIKVTCGDLATIAATLADGGVNPVTGERVIARDTTRDVLSVMFTCGMYDFAGQWAFEVGVPAKSGVGGGLLAVIPGKMGIAVFSPGLDPFGNSVRGSRVCQEISGRLGLHVFAGQDQDALLGPVQGSTRPRRMA